MSAWGYICDACKHPASKHRLVAGGDTREGPYVCQARPGCHCAISQASPVTGLGRSGFEAAVRRQDRLDNAQPTSVTFVSGCTSTRQPAEETR